MSNQTQVILTDQAPQPIGPYSQAIKCGNLLFCSGQVALDPKSGALVGTTVEEQTRRAMENLSAVLEKGGASFSTVIKTTLFLKNMADFPKVNEIYGSYFKGTPPARSTVEVSALPKGALFEIEAIAVAR